MNTIARNSSKMNCGTYARLNKLANAFRCAGGAYLSGGLDSSVVSALAAKQVSGSLEVFHGRFIEGEEFDESLYADH